MKQAELFPTIEHVQAAKLQLGTLSIAPIIAVSVNGIGLETVAWAVLEASKGDIEEHARFTKRDERGLSAKGQACKWALRLWARRVLKQT